MTMRESGSASGHGAIRAGDELLKERCWPRVTNMLRLDLTWAASPHLRAERAQEPPSA